MDDITQHPRYREARRYACRVRGFYVHLLVYLFVNAGLAALNYLGGTVKVWWIWPAFGWGIGLLAHALSVFAFGGVFGAGWEDRKVREYLSRHP